MIRFRFAAILGSGSVLVALLGFGCGDSSTTTAGTGASSSGTESSTTTASGTMSSTSTGMMPNPNVDCTPTDGTSPNLALTLVTDQLKQIVQATSAPDDPDRIYVVQKSGEIRIVENGEVLATSFLDLSNVVVDSGKTGELGLFGLAFDPNYATNGRFFVHYAEQGSNDNVIAEFKRSAGDPKVADPTQVLEVLRHTSTNAGNHNGGALGFGPDGYLYISIGDGGEQGDHDCDAQLDMGGDPTVTGVNLLGKISRVDVNAAPGADGYPAAPGNPNGLKSYHHGFRNPWRMSFDMCNGDLYVGDVGQDAHEEIDVFPQAMGPANAGWPWYEANNDYDPSQANCPTNPGENALVKPIAEYPHDGRCSVTGGYVYRSSAIPGIKGAYFYGDFCTGDVYYKLGSAAVKTTNLGPGGGELGGFGQDGRGNVYVTTLSGELYRIDQM